jgi:hypothetical protein
MLYIIGKRVEEFQKEETHMQSLTLEAADLIANKSLEKGRALGFAPLTV